MKTFSELFGDAYRIRHYDVARKIFWATLYRHAWGLAPFLGGFGANYFAADRELIADVGRATDISQIREYIIDYLLDSQNRGWLPHHAKIRVSTTRLKRLAGRFLPGGDSTSPLGPTDRSP